MDGLLPKIVSPGRFINRHLTVDLDYMNSLRESGMLCDIILIVEGVEFPVHKVILASSSPYFQAMFTSSFQEKNKSRQEIHEISHEAFSIILNHIYTGKEMDIEDDKVESLLEAACFLQLTHVKGLCLDHLRSMINCENVVRIRDFASRFDFTDVLQASNRFINCNFYQIVTNSSFLSLSEEEVFTIISSELPDVNRQLVKDCLEKWANNDASRADSLIRLKEKIKTVDGNCILTCSTQYTDNFQSIKIKFYDIERGPWFTLTDIKIPKRATVKALKYGEGKICVVTSPDELDVNDHADVHEYDVQTGCWNINSKKINYWNHDSERDYEAMVDSLDDVDNINF